MVEARLRRESVDDAEGIRDKAIALESYRPMPPALLGPGS
jgi:hypothetical protein